MFSQAGSAESCLFFPPKKRKKKTFIDEVHSRFFPINRKLINWTLRVKPDTP